jgi:hypothetical protein
MKKLVVLLLGMAILVTSLQAQDISYKEGYGICVLHDTTVTQVRIALVTLCLMPETTMKLILTEEFEGNLCMLIRNQERPLYLVSILRQSNSNTVVSCAICQKIGNGPDPQNLAGVMASEPIHDATQIEWVHKVEAQFFKALVAILVDQRRR